MELIIPSRDYYVSYLKAIHEYNLHGVRTGSFLGMESWNFYELVENYRTGKNMPDNFICRTVLWLVDNGEFIGEIMIRHGLDTALKRIGGHIGYAVKYSHWNKGYGTLMLSMALTFAGENFDFQRVLVTCNDDNYGSARVIEKNGGVLQDKVINVINGKERLTRRYWIEL